MLMMIKYSIMVKHGTNYIYSIITNLWNIYTARYMGFKSSEISECESVSYPTLPR